MPYSMELREYLILLLAQHDLWSTLLETTRMELFVDFWMTELERPDARDRAETDARDRAETDVRARAETDVRARAEADAK